MSTQAISNFKIDGWDEQAYLKTEDGGKLTRAHVKQTRLGAIDGHGEVEWLMCYRPDNTAEFVGLQRIVGRLGERSGSIVLESRGTFDGDQAKGPLRVVPGTGEVLSVWRRAVRAGRMTARRGGQAASDLQSLRIVRAPHRPLLPRVWELGSNLAPYDTAYVALAEALSVALLTADRRLAQAPGLQCEVELLV